MIPRSTNVLFDPWHLLSPDIPFSRHGCSIFKTILQPCMWFIEEPRQFSVGQTAQSLTCSIMENPHTGLDDCLNMLLSCFRKRLSVTHSPRGLYLLDPTLAFWGRLRPQLVLSLVLAAVHYREAVLKPRNEVGDDDKCEKEHLTKHSRVTYSLETIQ